MLVIYEPGNGLSLLLTRQFPVAHQTVPCRSLVEHRIAKSKDVGSVFPWRLILSLFNCNKKNEQKFSYMFAKAGVSYFSMRLESKSTLNLQNDLCTDHIFFFCR